MEPLQLRLLVLLFVPYLTIGSASSLEASIEGLDTSADACLSFGYRCTWNRDCCGGKKLECWGGICMCKDYYYWSPIDGKCIKIPGIQEEDDTLVIVLSVVGGVVGVIVIAVGVCCCLKQKKRRALIHHRTVTVTVGAPATHFAPHMSQMPPMPQGLNAANLGFVDVSNGYPQQPPFYQPGQSQSQMPMPVPYHEASTNHKKT